MVALTAVSREDALRITRVVELGEELTGGVMNAMAGATPVGLGSLAEVEAFLVPMTGEKLAADGVKGKIHHLDPQTLASWVRETIGDAELADRLGEIVKSSEPYGLLVPSMKELLAERVAQCEAVLAED